MLEIHYIPSENLEASISKENPYMQAILVLGEDQVAQMTVFDRKVLDRMVELYNEQERE